MASSLGPERLIQLLGPRQPCSRWATAGSFALHALVFALAGWATRGGLQRPLPRSSEQVTRLYAVHYLVLVRPPTRAVPQPERRPAGRAAPVAAVTISTTPPSMRTEADAGTRGEPQRSALQVQELPPGAIAGIGQAIPTPGSDATPGRGLAGMLALRAPAVGEVGPSRRGLDRVAELVNGAGSACPELPRPAAWATRQIAVAVAFVVDTNGRVDPRTLRVIESPSRRQTENRVHSHIYIVGATVRDDPDRLTRAAYDSLVTHEVATHVAELLFRPALSESRAIRSTVLVSCQTS
jgi:hypothetical protein